MQTVVIITAILQIFPALRFLSKWVGIHFQFGWAWWLILVCGWTCGHGYKVWRSTILRLTPTREHQPRTRHWRIKLTKWLGQLMPSSFCHWPPQSWHNGNSGATMVSEMEVTWGPNRKLFATSVAWPVGIIDQCWASDKVLFLKDTDGPCDSNWHHLTPFHPGLSSCSFSQKYLFQIWACLFCLQSLN